MKKQELVEEFYSTFGGIPSSTPQGSNKNKSEETLDIAAAWLNNTSSLEDLKKIELFIKQAKKKLEVFAIQKAITQATRYTQLYSDFYHKVLPKLQSDEVFHALSPKELIAMAQLYHNVLAHESSEVNQYLQKGPNEAPPIVSSRMSMVDAYHDEEVVGDAVTAFERLDPRSRDKLRSLMDGVERMVSIESNT